MDIHNKPIQERIDWLVDLARRYSIEFTSPDSYLARKRYFAAHPAPLVCRLSGGAAVVGGDAGISGLFAGAGGDCAGCVKRGNNGVKQAIPIPHRGTRRPIRTNP